MDVGSMQKTDSSPALTIRTTSGWWYTYPSENYEKLIIPNIWKIKCSKPPTRLVFLLCVQVATDGTFHLRLFLLLWRWLWDNQLSGLRQSTTTCLPLPICQSVHVVMLLNTQNSSCVRLVQNATYHSVE